MVSMCYANFSNCSQLRFNQDPNVYFCQCDQNFALFHFCFCFCKVTKKEEVIQQLRQENLKLEDEKQQAVDSVSLISSAEPNCSYL